VIATGGGIVVREANRRLLRERTVCVWLDARPSALLERLSRNNRRPLLQVADPRARLMELADAARAVVRRDGVGQGGGPAQRRRHRRRDRAGVVARTADAAGPP
jgi:shikimate kinase